MIYRTYYLSSLGRMLLAADDMGLVGAWFEGQKYFGEFPGHRNFVFEEKEKNKKDYMEEEEIKIIRTKRFGMKPMYPEDACIQMELLGHNFFVFVNAETDQVNVAYKRKGNTYGLIEPEY